MPATSFSNLITFSRGTNATVTDSTGRLTYAPNNLFTFSEQFDNAAWSKFATTVTANATTAPDGTTTADRILETTGTSTHLVAANAMVSVVTGQSYTISVYVKPSGRNWFRINSNFSGGSFASFDIANGVLGTVSGGTASITDAGNGWWRCSLTVVATSTGTASPDFRLATSNATISYAGNASLGVFLWGAQMEAVTYQTTPSTYYPTTVKNLLGYSEAFDNAAWTKSRASIVTGAQTNPVNGLFNAQKLMEDATASNTHRIFGASTTTAQPYCLSVYAKAGERSWMYLRLDRNGGTLPQAWFNLSAGTVGTVQTGLTASIQDLGNGWYRCAVVVDAAVAGASNLLIGLATANASDTYTGDGNSGVYIYGAQLSDSASLDPYVPTPAAAPSSTAYYGPRFDYDPVTLAPKGLLVEEARTNLVLRSQEFDNAVWDKFGGTSTVTANDTVSPDGTVNADKVVFTSGVNALIYTTSTVTAGTTYTASFYVKGTAGQTMSAYTESSGGTYSYASTAITLTGGWQRVSFQHVAATGNTGVVFAIRSSATDTAKTVWLYGAQLEAGSFATSYIPTVASTVTRSADVATITGSLFSGWYRQDQGTFLVSAAIATSANSGDRFTFQVDDGTASNRVLGTLDAGAQVAVDVGGVRQALLDGGTPNVGSPNKTGFAYSVNDFALSLNGGAVATDASGTIPTVNVLNIAGRANGTTSVLNGHILSIQYIPNATSDTQLQSLSTG